MNIKTFFGRSNKFHLFYLILLLAITVYRLIQWPIFAGDTDLWYHLNGGRYILQHMSIPKDSFFSFIEPPREWVDYYWLFQVFVYKIYTFFNYYGFVVFRAAIFTTTSFLLFCYLFKNCSAESPRGKPRGIRIGMSNRITVEASPGLSDLRGNDNGQLYLTMAFTLIFLFILPRYNLVRPHTFTYLFILVFLFILEHKPNMVIFLPIFGILWMNLHGIEYPVMLLICLSYTLEFFLKHIRDKAHIQKDELAFIVPIVLCMGVIYVTPHGSSLTWVPFIPTGFASHYIMELTHFSMDNLISFHITKMSISFDSLFNLILVMVAFSTIISIATKKIRLSHLLLAAGAVVLLTRGRRFGYEFALLTLPVVKFNASEFSIKHITNKTNKLIFMIVFAIISLMPFIYLKTMYPDSPKYPFSHKNLPHGIAIFLKHINAGGSVLNNPNYGGYSQWMLYPKYKIFMDMEVPFLFTNEDMYIASKMFINRDVLNNIISKYNPSFISVPLGNYGFKDLIQFFPDYRLIFFDDAEVLYAHKNHYSDIVEKYELKGIDPFNFVNKPQELLKKEHNINLALSELDKILKIYPDSGAANQFMAMFYNNKGLYGKATVYSDTIIKNYPEAPVGYKLKGDSYKGLNRFQDAIENYKMALKRSDSPEVHKEIGLIYFKQHKYKEAYDTLIKVTNIYAPGVTYKELYYVIFSAFFSNRFREAEIILQYARENLSVNDKEWYEKYQRLAVIVSNKINDK